MEEMKPAGESSDQKQVRVLLTGASGFIGTPCLELLAEAADGERLEIHALSRKVEDQDDAKPVQWHVADLLDPSSVAPLIERLRPTHLLHLAWTSGRDGFRDGQENYRWVGATLELLRLFAEAGGRRVVAVGTGAEYDWTRGGVCVEGQTPLDPSSTYGLCKRATGEIFGRFLSQNPELSGAWARLFFLYGPREDDDRLLSSVIGKLLRGEQAGCTYDLLERDYLFVEDAARGLVELLFSDVLGPIHIASGKAIPLGELVGRAADILGRRDLLSLGGEPSGEHPARIVRADIAKASQELDWRPRHSLDEAIEITVDWWRQHLRESSGH